MSRYRVTIERTKHYSHQVEVEADTAEDARRKVMCMDMRAEIDGVWNELQTGVNTTYEAEKLPDPEPVPELAPCPKCGKSSACLVHPAYDGGAYVKCTGCGYSDQVETWASTDAAAAKKWNAGRKEDR